MMLLALSLAVPSPAPQTLPEGLEASRPLVAAAKALQAAAPAAPPQALPSAAEVQALRDSVLRLQQCWYRTQDEACFWDLVAAQSPMRRPEERHEAYHGAFSGKPDPSTLKLEHDPETAREIEKEGRLLILNDIEKDPFMICAGMLYLTGYDGMDAADVAKLRAEGRLPPGDDFLIAEWFVDGEGYNSEAIATLWVREAGSWKFWAFSAYD